MADQTTSAKGGVLSPRERRQRNRQEVTNTILQVSRDIMREQGVAALTLNEVARRMKMRPPSLYEYFANKMAIYDRLFQMGAEMFVQAMRDVIERYPVANGEALEAHINMYVQFASDYPELFKLLFERHVPGFVPSEASMSAIGQAFDLGTARAQDIVDAGHLTGINALQVQDTLIVIMQGLAALHLANDPDASLESGRFGSLVPVIVAMLKKAWDIET